MSGGRVEIGSHAGAGSTGGAHTSAASTMWRATFKTRCVRRVGMAIVVITLAVAARAEPGDRWEGLHGLPRVAVDATVSPNHPDITPEDMRRRLEDTLRRSAFAPMIEPTAPDRLHLLITVRAYSSSDLRGFYLPLSQAYGIGPVRLIVERQAQIAGLGAPIPVQVWQAERQAKAVWRNSGAEILELVDEVIAAFLADYRRATGR
jgi:hypothetical protein